jgi:hypothetical protein
VLQQRLQSGTGLSLQATHGIHFRTCDHSNSDRHCRGLDHFIHQLDFFMSTPNDTKKPSFKVGNLVTLTQSDYPGLGQWFVQLWDGDEIVARVYGDDKEMLNCRIAALTTPPAAQHWHDLYKAKCQELHDERARLGAQVEALEELVQEPVGRTDQQIVDQTEELAGFLMRAFHRQEKADPLSTFRGTQDIRAQHCWQTACQIQEMLTATDPENPVAELDVKATPPAAQRQWVGLTDKQRNDCIKFTQQNLFARDGTTSQRIARAIEAKLKELNT